jgi:ABC-type Mn2+/Zn2+ transport system ATPase subunit
MDKSRPVLARELKTEMKSEVHRRKMLEGKSLSLAFVSGFYGAGKTTVIKQALGDVRNQTVRTLVLVNSPHQRTPSPSELAVMVPPPSLFVLFINFFIIFLFLF